MSEKKTVALGKKAAAVKASPATQAKPVEKPATKVAKPAPAPAKPKASSTALGKKANEVAVKIEVKNVPAIVGYGDRAKEVAKPSKTTAKLPAKSSGVASKMDKIKSSLAKAVAHPAKVEEVKEKPVAKAAEVKQEAVNQLDIASTRRPVTAVKKAVIAAGKVSFEEIQQMQASTSTAKPAAPFFDPTNFLKK